MDINFDVYFTKNTGTLYKDNEIDTLGKEGKVDLDLKEVSTLIVTFKVGETSFTDSVTIKDTENGLIQIPFKSDVIKQGLNSFEIVAIMKNGDVKASQTYCYHIEKSLENENSVVAETNYPILIQLLSDVQAVKDAEVIRIANEQARQVLKDEVLVLKTNLESLQSDLNSLDSTLTSNESIRQSNEETRQVLKANLESLQISLNTLENNVTSNEATREANETSRILEIANKVKEINDKILDVESRTVVKEADIENKIVNVENRCAAKEDLIDDKIIEVEGRIVVKETLVDNKIIEANTTIANTNIAKTNTEVATTNANTKITETEATRQSIITTINNLVAQFNALAPTSSTNAEVQLARTDVAGKTYASLQERLLADNKQQNILYSSVAGTYVTSDSVDGYAKNVVIEGNTYQDPGTLAIKSTGTKLSDGRYEIPLLSVGKNLWKGVYEKDKYIISTGTVASSPDWCATDFISVYPSKSLVQNLSQTQSVATYVCFYDKDKNFISGVNLSDTYTTPSNCRFVRASWKYSVGGFNFQVEYGTVATSFESYKEDKLTILSDVQIEKVGTVADRIVQLSDGKWYIEKNVGTYIFTGNEDWCIYNVNVNEVNTMAFTFTTSTCLSDALINPLAMLSNVLKYDSAMYNSDLEGIFLRSNVQLIAFRLNKSKLTTQDIAGFKAWLVTNGVYVKYKKTTPVYIPLPDDQQVALKTFANKTNILTLCEIEPTIKCDVPKSTSASINSISNKLDVVDSELEKIKKLEDATTSTVVDDGKGFVNISDTGNGYLSDLKIEGRTLVNLCGTQGTAIFRQTSTPQTIRKITGLNLIVGKLYTLSMKVTNYSGTISLISMDYTGGTNKGGVRNTINANGIYNSTFTPKTTITDIWFYFTGNGDGICDTSEIMIIEGDYTSNPPNGYIEGLKSVGQDVDKLVVSSTKGDGNLFDGELELGTLNTDGSVGFITDRTVNKNYVRVVGGKSLYLSNSLNYAIARIVVYDKDKKFIQAVTNGTTIPSNSAYCKFCLLGASLTNNVQLEVGIVATSYKPYQTDKKEILYLDTADSTWKKPVFRGIWSNGILTVGDTVDKHSDGKYYYHKRMSEVVLNGSESWVQYTTETLADYSVFQLDISLAKVNSKIICDKLQYVETVYMDTVIKEGISFHPTLQRLYIKILNSKLATLDVTGFKTWLASNITVVYELATEVVYECTPLDLSSFNGETNYLIESGSLSPRSSIKLSQILPNVVNFMKEKVEVLEDKVGSLVDDRTISKETDVGFVTITDTGNGYLSDLKIEGRTLNQIVANGNFASGTTGWAGSGATLSASNNVLTITCTGVATYFYPYQTIPNLKLSANKKIFVKATVKVTGTPTMVKLDILGGNQIILNNPIAGTAYTIYGISSSASWTESSSAQTRVVTYYADATTATGKVTEIQNVMALDLTTLGMTNYTADQINAMLGGYFEGLKSVGQDATKIVVSSIKGDGNLFDVNNINKTSNITLTSTGFNVISDKDLDEIIYNKIRITETSVLSLNIVSTSATTDGTLIQIVNEDDSVINIKKNATSVALTKSIKYIKLLNWCRGTHVIINISINKGTAPITYRPMETDKKEILYLDTVDSTWKKPTFRGIWSNGVLTVGDTVDKHADGKYYYHKRCGEVTFNGGVGEAWAQYQPLNEIGFAMLIPLPAKAKVLPMLCDKFNYISTNDIITNRTEGFATNSTGDNIYLCLNKSKATDVATGKTYLTSNPITIVYPLATEQVYECTPLDLSSYSTETNYYVESGVLSPRSTIKVTSYIWNIINNLKEKVSISEDNNNFLMVKILNHEVRLTLHNI